MNAVEFMKKYRFVCILRRVSPEYAEKAAKALYDGGIRIFEITFDPSSETTIQDTTKFIRTLYSLYGDEICVGAGTVLKKEYAEAAYEAGAKFIVAPNTDEEIISYTKSVGMASVPGAYTPTEVMNAYKVGADMVKIFPILPDGEAYLKNIISPLSHIPFMVTGGINPDTIDKFMSLKPVCVAAGVTIISNDMCKNGEYDKIKLNAEKHLEKISKYLA